MRVGSRESLGVLLVVCLLGGCKGTFTSDKPLLNSNDASFPLPSGAEVAGQSLTMTMSEREGRTARILVVDGSYRISAQDRVASASGSFLLKQISDDQFVAQASNDSDWAYGLTARADVYSLFTFNRNDQNCTNLSSDERASLRAIIRG